MFSSNSGIQDQPELIPNGTLANALLVIKGLNTSKTSGATYLNLELRITDGPYEGRVIFDMTMNPFDSNCTDKARRMGIMTLTRICEAVGIFKHDDESSYARYNESDIPIQDIMFEIDSQVVPIKIKVEKGTDGHADKNRVGEWLTPNPKSGPAFKAYEALKSGQTSVGSASPGKTNAFSGSPAQAPSAQAGAPAWLGRP